MLSKRTDIEIIEFKKGDVKAFEVIYKRFFPAIYSQSRILVQDPHAAEDITAETFVVLWKMREQFDSYQRIYAFLRITSRNRCMDYFRLQKRSLKQEREMTHLFGDEKDTSLWEWEEYKAELLRFVREEIERLSPRLKEVMKLAFQEGLSNPQISAKLNIAESTVKNLKVLGIKKLNAKAMGNKQLVSASAVGLGICLQHLLTI